MGTPATNRLKRRNSTVALCASSVIAALCVVILLLGCLLETLDLSCAGICCLLVWMVLLEYGTLYAGLLYFAVTLAALLLLPTKTPCLLFAFSTGWYPIAKYYFDRLPKWLGWVLKLATVNGAAVLLYLFFKEVLGMQNDPLPLTLCLLLLYNLCFFLLDFAMKKLIPFYVLKLRPRLPKAILLKK